MHCINASRVVIHEAAITTSPHFVPGVGHPAVSPHVTGVGGTNLVTTMVTNSLQSKYVTENAYGDPEVP